MGRKVLFLTSQLPYPAKSGGTIKTWRMLQHLAQHHDVMVVCPTKGDEDEKNVRAFTKSIPLHECFTTPVNRKRSPTTLVASYLKAPSLNVYRNQSKVLLDAIVKRALTADLLIVDHYEMGQYVPDHFTGKVILHQHNAEYVMWDRLAAIEKNPIKKAVLRLESQRIARTERSYCKRADLVWAAPNDIDELEKIGVDRRRMKVTYHLGEDDMMQWPDVEFKHTAEAVLYVGTLTWEANVDGLLWFLEMSWPAIKKSRPQVKLNIVGKNPDARLVDAVKNDAQVVLHGFVDDLRKLYDANRVFICPLRFGSGIKVKVLNAMYRGMPTVTSSIGIEGLDVANGVNVRYSDGDGAQFARDVIDLLTSEAKWNNMRDEARKLGNRYTWKTLMARHDNEIEALFETGVTAVRT